MNALCEAVKIGGPVAGRILLALIFVISGFGKLTGFEGTVGYIASQGLPLPLPQLGAIIAIVVELGAGILLIVGWQARWAATVLFLFLIPTTFLFHNFWAYDGPRAGAQQIQFMKNLCIMGGMLYVMAFGAGAFNRHCTRVPRSVGASLARSDPIESELFEVAIERKGSLQSEAPHDCEAARVDVRERPVCVPTNDVPGLLLVRHGHRFDPPCVGQQPAVR